ncbi:hopanoid-associated phosphorylase [Methylocaldum marinum]|uniref:Hopanoid-associated phosphorylase n=1 Tax=Methylocaldum marinum TaxID=1432792 RepID=A0A250KRN2_9GAMM|nr:phosphorylase [Methylocaldum marinum]BBA34315.1 hopanoid-associated phosphorylase [Methylocaldum marinum]
MKSIGFVIALPAEARTLARRRAGFGELLELAGGHRLIVSGAGPNHAQNAASRLLELKVDALVSWGCAAALDHTLNSGDLVLPERILAPDGCEHSVCFEWHERVRRPLAPVLRITTGPLLGSSKIIAGSAEKQELHLASGAVAVDMESASVASVAKDGGLPFLAVRAVADPARMSLPASVTVAVDERGDVKLPKLLGHALANPADFITLARLGKAFYAATSTLRRTALVLGTALSLKPSADG